MNQPFTMVAHDQHLTGKEKAAILLSELGGTSERIYEYLDTKQLRELRKAVRSLGSHVDWQEETSVLQETHAYGLRKGYVRPIHSDAEIAALIKTTEHAEKENGIRNMMVQNPDAIAQVLSKWLKEE